MENPDESERILNNQNNNREDYLQDTIRINKNGDNSPESGSLYSDEIPSGYNSGEQYDTLSTGYMSGEAYELPETRMDLREPSLGNVAEEENECEIFPITRNSSTDSAREQLDGDGIAESSIRSPTANKMIMLMRPGKSNKPTFSMMEPAILIDDGENNGVYRTVPSDTDDTSVFESDAVRGLTIEEGAMLSGDGGMTTSDSGAELLGNFKKRFGRRSKRHGSSSFQSSSSKRSDRDEVWFNQNDNKYWGLTRIICFWGSIISIIGCIVAAGIVIATMPKSCDPVLPWYQGSISTEISLSDNFQQLIDGGIQNLKDSGVRVLVIKFDENDVSSTTKDFLLKIIPKVFINDSLIGKLSQKLHDNDMALVVEMPVIGDVKSDNEYRQNKLSLELEHSVANVVKFWAERGADGIILRGLDVLSSDPWIGKAISDWRTVLVKYGTSSNTKILAAQVEFAVNVPDKKLLKELDLLDATLISTNGSFLDLQSVADISTWEKVHKDSWIHWNLDTVRPLSNAAVAFHMMLPGTIGFQREDAEYSGVFSEMARLRYESVPIYMNGNFKKCYCPDALEKETNFEIHFPIDGLVQFERFYSRRNRMVYVGNFHSNDSLSLEPISKTYAGGYVQIHTGSASYPTNEYALLKDIRLNPGQAIVIKIPK